MIGKNTTFMIVSLLLVGLDLLCLCESAARAETQYRISMVGYDSTATPFWIMAEKGLNDMAAKYSELEVTYLGTAHQNIEQFLNTLQSEIASRPDAVMCPLIDPMYMDEILRPAIAEGLPVVAIHATDGREPGESRIPVLASIGADSYAIGQMAAQEALQRLTPKRALFCNHEMGTEKIDTLGRGWVETMQAEGIVAEQLNVASSGGGFGTELLAAYLLSHPETDTIFTADFSRTLAFIMRLEADGYQIGQEINMIQLGSDPLALEFIKQGKIAFTLDRQPYLQAYLGVMLAYAHLKHGFKSSQTLFSIDPVIITEETKTDVPTVKLPAVLLENLKSEGMPEEMLNDLQSLEAK